MKIDCPVIPPPLPALFEIGDWVDHGAWMFPLLVVDVDVSRDSVWVATRLELPDVEDFCAFNSDVSYRLQKFPTHAIVEIEYPESDLLFVGFHPGQ